MYYSTAVNPESVKSWARSLLSVGPLFRFVSFKFNQFKRKGFFWSEFYSNILFVVVFSKQCKLNSTMLYCAEK